MKRYYVIGATALAMLLAAPAAFAQGRDPGRDGDTSTQRGDRAAGDRNDGFRRGDRSRTESGSNRSSGATDRATRGGQARDGYTRDRSGQNPQAEGSGSADRGRSTRGSSDRSSTRNGGDRVDGGARSNDRAGRRYGNDSVRGDEGYRRGGSSSDNAGRDDGYRRGASSRAGTPDYQGSRSGSDRAGSSDRPYRSGANDRLGSRVGRDDGFRRGGGGRSASSGRSSWSQYRARDFASEHRSWADRGGYRGYRIPDAYFGSHFGRSHFFRASELQFVFIGGEPCFDYDRYRFTFLDPYPEYWGDNWYDTDDCYVDYVDDGYYLCNRRFPNRPGVAISISLRF